MRTAPLGGVAAALAALAMLPGRQASAAPPSNDTISAAIEIDALPFTITEDTREATDSPDDPLCSGHGDGTVWFVMTPAADVTITADTLGSSYDTTLSVYTGSPGALHQVACNDDNGNILSRVDVALTGGVTYWFMVGTFFMWYEPPGGTLVFNVAERSPLATAGITLTEMRFDPRTRRPSVEGLVTCSRATKFRLSGTLVQQKGHALASARLAISGVCDDVVSWAGEVSESEGRFLPGKAALILQLRVTDEHGEIALPTRVIPVDLSPRR